MKQVFKSLQELNTAVSSGDVETTKFVPDRNQKYNIVSTVAFLGGFRDNLFGDDQNFDVEIYNKLKINKNARIMRNLCMIRANIERSYYKIYKGVTEEGRSVLNMSEFISQDAVNGLAVDKVKLNQKPTTQPIEYIIQINDEIKNRINNCRNLFPEWINWEYVRDLFLMPDGCTEEGAKASADEYYHNISCYPYKTYLNWPVPHEDGNVLFNDKRFVTLLYLNNQDDFTDWNKVIDVSDRIKVDLYDFIARGNKIDMIVDCENSDVYNITAMLRGLDWEYLQKINKIILVEDININAGWNDLKKDTDIPIEEVMTHRVMENKSLVDGQVYATAFKEYYKENVDSFILLSSDSDFWTLVTSLMGDANIVVMLEHMYCSPKYIEKLDDAGVFYCYLDDFYSGDETEQRKTEKLLASMESKLNNQELNLIKLMDETLLEYRIRLVGHQKEEFIKKYLRTLKVSVDEKGNVTYECGNRR